MTVSGDSDFVDFHLEAPSLKLELQLVIYSRSYLDLERMVNAPAHVCLKLLATRVAKSVASTSVHVVSSLLGKKILMHIIRILGYSYYVHRRKPGCKR
jgi:hypothetical protein